MEETVKYTGSGNQQTEPGSISYQSYQLPNLSKP